MNTYDGYGWIKVKKYIMDESKPWEERYRELDKHHVEETTFLIDTVRKLARELVTQARAKCPNCGHEPRVGTD